MIGIREKWYLVPAIVLSMALVFTSPALSAPKSGAQGSCTGKYRYIVITEQELQKIIAYHGEWLQNKEQDPSARTEKGKADLCGANLSKVSLTGANLTGANLTGAVLSKVDLTGAGLSEANLSGADLSEVKLDHANLTGANLVSANLTGANLTGANLSKVDLSGAGLSEAMIGGANLDGANLSGAYLNGANLSRTSLKGANLSGADSDGANLSGAYLSGANLSRTSLKGANLEGANLSGASLKDANLDRTSLKGTNLSGVALSGINLYGVELTEANLSQADFSGANLKGTNLKGTNLNRVNLSGFDLTGAGLAGVNLSEAVLDGSNLSRANLIGANLIGASLIEANLSNANLSKADLTGANLSKASLSDADLSNTGLKSAVFELRPGLLPDVPSVASASGLPKLTYRKSPHSLIALREAFKRNGLRKQEREVTYAIEYTRWRLPLSAAKEEFGKQTQEIGKAIKNRAWRSALSQVADVRHLIRLLEASIEGFIRFVLFEVTSNYGMSPGRPLIIIIVSILIFSIPYMVALRFDGEAGIWQVWSSNIANREEVTQSSERLFAFGFDRFRIALHFSLLSAFHIGWRDFHVGSMTITRRSPDYVLRPSGWVRRVADLQAIISVYLLALSVFTYFGRPFE